MGPVRENPIQRTVRSLHVCVHCTVHNCCTKYFREQTWLIIFPLTLQTITIAPMMSTWGKGVLDLDLCLKRKKETTVINGCQRNYRSLYPAFSNLTSYIRQHQLPTSPLLIDGCSVSPVKSVRDLGIHTDSDLTMQTHVKRTISRCFASLRQLRQNRHLVPTATL